MNGFSDYAEFFKKEGNEKEARLYSFLGTCDEEDFCYLFDSTAFNDIAKAYLRKTVKELVEEDVIDEEQAQDIRRRFVLLFDLLSAKQVLDMAQKAQN